jgi:CRP/FNR family cyclic AMP-dependent transcriptional regulator
MDSKINQEKLADVKRLITACLQNNNETSLGQYINLAQWELLAPYLQSTSLAQAQVLITQGSTDRTVYFVENGSLSVHYEDESGRVRLAIIGPGTAVGEGSFFSHLPRNATVQAASASRVWGLTNIRFSELCNRLPAVALSVALALGALIASRMADRRKRISIT